MFVVGLLFCSPTAPHLFRQILPKLQPTLVCLRKSTFSSLVTGSWNQAGLRTKPNKWQRASLGGQLQEFESEGAEAGSKVPSVWFLQSFWPRRQQQWELHFPSIYKRQRTHTHTFRACNKRFRQGHTSSNLEIEAQNRSFGFVSESGNCPMASWNVARWPRSPVWCIGVLLVAHGSSTASGRQSAKTQLAKALAICARLAGHPTSKWLLKPSKVWPLAGAL